MTSDDIHPNLRTLFWDVDFDAMTWEQHQIFIIRRILENGDGASIGWLRSRIGDDGLRSYIITHEGRGLSPRQLCFWELILNLKHEDVAYWINTVKNEPWEKRISL